MPKQVKKTLLVDKEQFDLFKSRHPAHGAFTWFVDAALKKFNELNEVDTDELISIAMSDINLK